MSMSSLDNGFWDQHISTMLRHEVLEHQRRNCVRSDAQVGRETEVDCALAELYVRTLSTENLVRDTAHSDIFNSIYTRMSEVGRCT